MELSKKKLSKTEIYLRSKRKIITIDLCLGTGCGINLEKGAATKLNNENPILWTDRIKISASCRGELQFEKAKSNAFIEYHIMDEEGDMIGKPIKVTWKKYKKMFDEETLIENNHEVVSDYCEYTANKGYFTMKEIIESLIDAYEQYDALKDHICVHYIYYDPTTDDIELSYST